MHVLIRRYTATPEVVTEAQPKLQSLEQVMRSLPGFVAYYLVQTDDGLASITLTEDERGSVESMARAADGVQRNLQTASNLGSPEVTLGTVLMCTTR
jgi:hypothetical protein